MLEVRNLSVSYSGNIKAVRNVNMVVHKNEIVVLIGANGAGKTTILRALSGLVTPGVGSYARLDLSGLTDKRTLNRFAGHKMTDKLLEVFGTSQEAFKELIADDDITEKVLGKKTKANDRKIKALRARYNKYVKVNLLKIKPHEISSYGVAHVPEGRQVFANLTVQENLEMGAYRRHSYHKIKKDLEEVYTRFPRLKERSHQKAGTLSGGEQQMLAIARALMAKPKLIFLDEPSMGLSPIFVKEVFRIIEELKEMGITVVLVEQNAKLALSIADRAYVLETGNIVLEGTGQELLNHDKVKEAYLGS